MSYGTTNLLCPNLAWNASGQK